MNPSRDTARSATALLEVLDLHTWFRAAGETVRAVDGASFHIEPGETFCLVGESGSGKSVSALSVIGLLPHDLTERCDGEVLFRFDRRAGAPPRDLLGLPEQELMRMRGGHIAMIFQEPMTSLNPVFTVGDQIIEAIQLARPGVGYEEARRRAIEALAEVRIERPELRVDEYPHRLSGGQRQRVMIAMAIACRPELLIADEPTTALDVTVQAEILGLMQELQRRRGMSLFFITHDFGVVAQIADRVAVMREGRIVETGTLEEVLERPVHAYTRQLLAAVPENLARTTRRNPDAGGVPQAPAVASGPIEAPPSSQPGFGVRLPSEPDETDSRFRGSDGVTGNDRSGGNDVGPAELVRLDGAGGALPHPPGRAQAHGGTCAGGGRRGPSHPPGTDPRAGGRIGLRQDHARTRDSAPRRAHRGTGAFRRAEADRPLPPGDAPDAPPAPVRVPGPRLLAQPSPHRGDPP